MSSWTFHTTNEYLDFLDFHDCCVKEMRLVGDSTIVLFDSINVSSEHPLNPFEVAKTTDVCELTFNGVTRSDVVLFIEDDREQHVAETSLTELEVLKFTQQRTATGYIFEVFGTDWGTHQFCRWKIQASSFGLCWNEYIGDAWYVEK